VFTTENVLQGQFLAEYCGKLIDEKEGERREAVAETGFRFFFHHHGAKYWYWHS